MAKSKIKSTPAYQAREDLFYKTGLYGLIILLLFPPFFRGLFFPTDQAWALAFASLIFFFGAVWVIRSRENFISRQWLELAIIFLLLAYVIAFIGAPNKKLALDAVFRMAMYLQVFLLTAYLVRNVKTIERLLIIIYGTAVGVAAAGILSALGVIDIKDGFADGRIFSTFQYPNTLAIYLGAAAIIGFYLWCYAKKETKYLYAIGNTLLFLAFLGANSRGAFLLFPIALAAFLILYPKGNRKSLVIHLLMVAAASIAGSIYFIPAITAGEIGLAYISLAAGILLALLAQYLTDSWRIAEKVSVKWLGMAAVAGVLLVGAVVKLFSLGQYFLPAQLLARLQTIGLQDYALVSRVYWMGDALYMIRQSPLIGMGGGAWEASYKKYQSHFYSSTQVHNDWLQIWIEVGTLGFLLWAALWFFFFRITYLNFKRANNENEKGLQITLATAAFAVGLHSWMDFNLSFGAVMIFLYALFGLARGHERLLQKNGSLLPKSALKANLLRERILIAGAGIMSALLILLPASAITASAAARQAVAFIDTGNAGDAFAYFSNAVRFDPLNAAFAADLAWLYLEKGNKKAAIKMGQRAVELDRNNNMIICEWPNCFGTQGRLRKPSNMPLMRLKALHGGLGPTKDYRECWS